MVRKRKPRRARPLADVLTFRFEEPIDRFCETFYVEKADARPIWKDLLRYMWLCATVKEAEGLEPPRIMDEMWHMFLVYTPEYRAWSMKYFGAFLDHKPRTTKQKRELERLARSADPSAMREHLIKSMSAVWDHLGERVALRWFVTYPTRYATEFYERRRPVPPEVALKLPQALIDKAMKA
jgi:hypothetical protein